VTYIRGIKGEKEMPKLDTITIRSAAYNPYANEDDFIVVRVQEGSCGSRPALPAKASIISAAYVGRLESDGVVIVELPR
jgi:hypothetical protein